MVKTFAQVLEARPVGRFQVAVVAVSFMVLVIDGIDIQLLSLVAPQIIDDWQITRTAFGPALAAALTGMVIGSLVGGWLGDRFGRLLVLVGATLLFGAATILAATTGSPGEMALLRLVSGVGFGAAGPNALALASEWLPQRLRPRVATLLAIGTPTGGILGAWIVLLLLPDLGWRGVFVACGLTTMALVLPMLAMREPPENLQARGKGERARANARWFGGAEVDLGSLAAGDRPETKSAAGNLFSRELLRLNLGAGLGFFFAAMVAYGMIAWTPVVFTSAGYSLDVGIRALFVFNLASVICSLLIGFVIERLGSRRVIMLGSAGMLASSLALYWLMQAATALAWLMQAVVAANGATTGITIATIYAMMIAGFPSSCRSAGLGYGLAAGRLGGVVLSLAGGVLLDAAGTATWPFFTVLAVASVLAGLGAVISDRHLVPQPKGAA
ncbi:MFS transporter [Aurantiacibacter xanthus]|uniref:MFS transporter n=1 Tax=Aurantiacibacter xanthus TaxID=1784712 RepID=A0A3A1P0J3_9SPHN|nr:MFS transporter [Aurantiacibacter xanthus]RIV82239.1 MFS transporter [Aurantiacibacter xanthus]